MERKVILITGCKGQLGTEMQKSLRGYKFLATDRDTLDLIDLTPECLTQNGVTHIVNCAAYTDVNGAESHRDEAFAANAEAVGKMAKAAKAAGVRVLHISTDYVFDGIDPNPYSENAPVNPLQIYGQSKLQGEQLLMRECEDAIIIRTQWLYSPHGHNFVKTMLRLAEDGKPIRVVNDQFGSPTSAQSLAEAICQILGSEWVPGVYHYSNIGLTTWFDFAKETLKLAGYAPEQVIPISTAEYPTPAIRPEHSELDKSKIINRYSLLIPLWQEALQQCIAQIYTK